MSEALSTPVLPASGTELAPPSVLPLPVERSCHDAATTREKHPYGKAAGKRRERFTLARRAALLAAIPEAKGNLVQAARLAGVPYPTVFDHMTNDRSFLQEINQAKAALSQTLVDVAYNRALQPSGNIDRWKLLPSWNPLEYGQSPTVQVNVNHAQLAFGDGTPAFPQPQQVVLDVETA